MSAGRVIAVVGPSGVGKDSVMAGIAAAEPTWAVAQRVITRDASAGGEDFVAVTETIFMQDARAGAFCLHWDAHGLRYGIPQLVLDRAMAGQNTLINLSRSVLTAANDVFPNFAVICLTASAKTLNERLKGRGRENTDDIRKRRSRSGADVPSHINAITISNDGPLSQTIADARTGLGTRLISQQDDAMQPFDTDESPLI